ncbi:MAG: hypothetical protein BWY31_02704 [Lentisphaerae bacterium ADurb.Bin242]|nr:MAG: hypothetical protein BWY31_02704 [Lentisphaerae bacterium ADurb.Bin242]
MKELKIGYLALSKLSWRTPKIDALMTDTVRYLEKIPGCKLIHPDALVTSETEAEAGCARLNEKGIDLLVMHFVTFPAGALIPCIANRIQAPVVLLANPEKPGPGKMWEQNSFCGANLGAFVMRRLEKQYGFVKVLPAETPEALAPFIAAARCIRALRDCRIGLAGGRVPGFYTSNFDEMKTRSKFGAAVEVADLLEVVETAKTLSAEQLAEGRTVVKKSASGVCGVPDAELELAAKMFASFKAMAAKYRLTALAIRCWPEFSDFFGIAPCAVIGMLNDNGIPASCEGDVPGALTMTILRELAGGGLPLFVDLISYDEKENTGVVWHCGAAPVSLCRKFEETQYRLHFRVDGGDRKGVTNDFSLKTGRVTLAKLDQDVDGHFRMLIAPGTAIDTEPFIRGNPLTIRFDRSVGKLIDTIMRKGFEHHYTVIHADVTAELLQFCAWMNIEPVMPE